MIAISSVHARKAVNKCSRIASPPFVAVRGLAFAIASTEVLKRGSLEFTQSVNGTNIQRSGFSCLLVRKEAEW